MERDAHTEQLVADEHLRAINSALEGQISRLQDEIEQQKVLKNALT